MLHILPPSEIVQTYMENTGNSFGKCALSYASGRKAYPQEVFDLLSSRIALEESILELGCGTGLATKQLYDGGFKTLIATDMDPLMLEHARIHCPNVLFQAASANNLPFQDHAYAAVVAFGCFHWFCTNAAIQEIKRVLQPQGMVFIINKYDTGPFREKFRCFLEKMESKPFSEAKASYQPIEMLTASGFEVVSHAFESKEIFTKPQLLAYAKSISLWTALSYDRQEKLSPSLLQFIDELMENEYYDRPIEIRCLIATPKTSNQKF